MTEIERLQAELATARKTVELMLREAQTIRINQVQMVGELKKKKPEPWPTRCVEKCDQAWQRLNQLDKAIYDAAHAEAPHP